MAHDGALAVDFCQLTWLGSTAGARQIEDALGRLDTTREAAGQRGLLDHWGLVRLQRNNLVDLAAVQSHCNGARHYARDVGRVPRIARYTLRRGNRAVLAQHADFEGHCVALRAQRRGEHETSVRREAQCAEIGVHVREARGPVMRAVLFQAR